MNYVHKIVICDANTPSNFHFIQIIPSVVYSHCTSDCCLPLGVGLSVHSKKKRMSNSFSDQPIKCKLTSIAEKHPS